MSDPILFVSVSVALALLPIVLSLCTSFLKFQVVLHFIRSGLGTQHVPNGMVIMALSLALTGVVMAPQIQQTRAIFEELDIHKSDGQVLALIETAGPKVLAPWKEFMIRASGPREREFFATLAQSTPEDTQHAGASSWLVVLPAFVVSELQAAFRMGFLLLIPFLVIDLVVANILVGMGMFMVSPVLITLPLKIAVFLLSDGWLVICRTLILSYPQPGSP